MWKTPGYTWAGTKSCTIFPGRCSAENVVLFWGPTAPERQRREVESWNGRDMVLSGPDGTIGLLREPTPEEEEKAAGIMKSLKAEHLIDRPVVAMSSGEQVKVLIARALMTNPELMILDEPSVYLDLAGREFLLKTIEELAETRPDLTIVFITQRIEDILPVFNRGMILKSGEIVAHGSRDEVLTEENLKDAFGLDIQLIKTEKGRLWTVIR